MNTGIGFTGSRHGMTDPQKATLRGILIYEFALGRRDFHEGDCVGSDLEASKIAADIGFRIIAHPPERSRLRAWGPAHCVLPTAGYHERNRHIVDATGVLLATPDCPEQDGSGTWFTVRYARSVGRPYAVIWSDGSVTL